jgi:hypothetical protein
MDWYAHLVLAQASSGIADFFQQIPVGLIVMFCGSSLLLIAAAFLIVRARAQRTQKTAPEHPYVPVQGAANVTAMPDPTLADLPDLDMLVTAPPPMPKPTTAPAPARAPRTGTYTVNLSDGDPAQAVEVVTILRDVMDGGLIIQMGGKSYRDLTQDETFRASFLKIMRELSPVVTQAPKSAAKPAAAESELEPAPQEQPAASRTASLRDLLVSSDDVEDEAEKIEEAPAPRPASPPPPPTADGTMPGDLPRYSLDSEPQVIKKRSGLLRRTKTEFVPVPELNLAGAIEAYLQHKLRHTPEYAARSIHVHPAEDGGVAIEVDGEFYEAVGDVAEADVRAFLASTIQEWQERNSRK